MLEIVAVSPQQLLERILTSKSLRVTEASGGSAARLRGRGNKIAADQTAVDAMRANSVTGTVRIIRGQHRQPEKFYLH